LLIGGFAMAELVVGLQSHSLALLADSEHMVSDGLALGLALLATWIAQFPASEQAPFGYRRVEILAALANGLGLVAIALWIAWEAILCLQRPAEDILSIPMLITAGVGVVVNGINVFMLHEHSHHDLNLKGAFLHMVADMVGSLGVLVAAIAIQQFHWLWADGAVSLLVSGLIITGAVPLIWQSLRILLEQPPAHVNWQQVQQRIVAMEGVVAVTQLRIWTIAPGQEMLAAWITVQPVPQQTASQGNSHVYRNDRNEFLNNLRACLQEDFGFHEVILQISEQLPAMKPIDMLERSLLDAIGKDFR
jgi:cobalt-zinc-cadmium efflux system protein